MAISIVTNSAVGPFVIYTREDIAEDDGALDRALEGSGFQIAEGSEIAVTCGYRAALVPTEAE